MTYTHTAGRPQARFKTDAHVTTETGYASPSHTLLHGPRRHRDPATTPRASPRLPTPPHLQHVEVACACMPRVWPRARVHAQRAGGNVVNRADIVQHLPTQRVVEEAVDGEVTAACA
eukprot:363811-Chlamydomonas_euryale.AAC.18